jgi:hypothetical protein
LAGADKCLNLLRNKFFRFGGDTIKSTKWEAVYIQDDLGNKYDRGYVDAYGSLEAEHDEAKWRTENPDL